MLFNYLKVAYRNLVKRRVTTAVNLIGLGIGISATILLVLYAQYELSYDDFHKDTPNTYRILRSEDLGDNTQILAKSSPRIMLSIVDEFPEVTHSTTMFKHWNVPLLSQEDKGFYEKDFLFADSSFFDVFGFELIVGDPSVVLSEPFSLVITERMATKYFGDEDPIGKILRYELKHDFVVSGIVRENDEFGSHFKFDFLASMPSLRHVMWYDILTGGYNGFFNYIRLMPGTEVNEFNLIYQDWLADRFPDENLQLQPMKDIHLKSDALAEIEPQSDIMFVRVVIIIAIVVIILATINYINSAVSSSVERLKEMGVRMVSGAFGPQIFLQFILEAMLTISFAIAIAVLILNLSLMPFNELLDTHLKLDPFGQWQIWTILGVSIFSIAAISGTAPAIVILRMELTDVLLNVVTIGRIGYLRKGLMIFQFVVSVILIVGAFTINRQAAFVKSKDLGFNQNKVMVVPIRDRGIHRNYESFKDKIMTVGGVSSASRAMAIPGRPFASEYYKPEVTSVDSILMNVTWIGDDYFETLGIDLLAGTDFEFLKSTEVLPVVVNETLVIAFEMGEPFEALGMPLYNEGIEYRIMGVIRDFNYETLHNTIQPLVIHPGEDLEDFMIIKYASEDDFVAQEVSDFWYGTAYEQPFTHSLLTEDLEQLYISEKVWGDIGNMSMIISLIIGGLGVFGLVSLVVQKRFKEMGIRKIFGASNGNIIGIIYSEFFTILFVTLLVASPAGYYLAQLWLQDFAYRINVPVDAFVIAITTLFGVTCLAVLFHTFRALGKNPMNSLKD